MKKTLLAVAITVAGSAIATPFNGNDAQSNAMGNTGVASSEVQNAVNFNPALLADQYDGVGFGMTLPSFKFYVDDSKGFIKSAGAFTESGGTWDQVQTIDSAALESAVGDIATTMTAIGGDVDDITQAILDIETAVDNNDQPAYETAVDDLGNASASLSSNSATLDTTVVSVSTQVSNLNNTSRSAQSDLTGLSSKPLQLGLGLDILNAALPSEGLGLAVGISTNTAVGSTLNVASEDLDPIVDLTGDLSEYSTEATNLTAAVSALAAANADLTLHFQNAPAFGSPEYQAWEDELAVKEQAIIDAQGDVDDSRIALDNFNGSNGTIVNGSINFSLGEDPQSEIEFVGANITEVSVSAARRFVVGGEDIAFGVTPKIQSINIFEKTINLSNSSSEMDQLSADPSGYFLNNTTSLMRVNVDFGAAKTWDFYGKVRAGVALKDLIPWTLESKSGTELLIRPKLRVGAAHETKFTKVAVDLDITENKPLKYGVPTRYFGLGGEVNAWGWAALRAGYRANLSVENSSVVSGGIGLTPFGVGVEISAWAKPTSLDDWAVLIQDMGAVVEFSMNF
ncbi:conjugal transfer protein TraF [Reinekea marina]|uniref:Conjugal transfer protein TraF n=1 Tax=Reinekea marina TaxID=1310421 RepID=A0ABV7WLA6_9GAMM|nr:conjugal transfer protein TraF [Reinekea marina]MDN3648310.1 conjugal transfer protein TraF [Reinekea marina]